MIVNSNNDQDWCWLPPWLSDYRHNSGGRIAGVQSLSLTPPWSGETGDVGDGSVLVSVSLSVCVGLGNILALLALLALHAATLSRLPR